MSKYLIAFRIFGRFLWPPLPSTSGLEEREGVIELLFADEPSNPDKLPGILCWKDKKYYLSDSSGEYPDLEDIQPIPCLGDSDLQEMFGQQQHEPVLLRLDPPELCKTCKPSTGIRLAFRGASLLHQFRLGEADPQNKNANLDLRLPLVRKIGFGKDEDFYSEVLIGQPDDYDFRFNIALPTPLTQTTENEDRQAFLPFSLVYPPVAVRNFEAFSAETFVAGRVGRLGLNKAVKAFEKLATDKRALGHFGFARDSGHTKDYLPFQIDKGRRERLWPESASDALVEVLTKAGLKIPEDQIGGKIDYMGNSGAGERILSLRFNKRDTDGVISGYTYRVALTPKFPAPKPFGDLSLKDAKFGFNLPENLNGWLNTDQSNLLVDIETEFQITDDTIWGVDSDLDKEHWPAKVSLRLIWKHDPPTELGPGGPLGFKSSDSAEWSFNEILDNAIVTMRLARLDLQNINAGQPQSFFPEMNVWENGALFLGTFAEFKASLSKNGSFTWGSDLPGFRPQPPRFRLSLVPGEKLMEGELPSGPKLTFRVWLPSFQMGVLEHGKHHHLYLEYDPAAESGTDCEHFAFFRLSDSSWETEKLPLYGRLGALQFKRESSYFLLARNNEDDYSFLRLKAQQQLTSTQIANGALDAAAYPVQGLTVRLRLWIDSIEPITVDMSYGDRSRRPRPLLISTEPVPPPSASAGPNFILDVRETISGAEDRQLVARIFDLSSSRATNAFVVLSDEPFSITKFFSRPLADRGDASTNAVAFFDSDTRQWQLKLVSPYYHYIFPPQVAGESADKPRRLEIHDLTPGGSDPNRPAIADEQKKYGLRRRAVEFRLTPSAELWIRPSDLERGYFLPEWAGYELFRQIGALGIGAALEAFRGEFLYGLSVGIFTKKEDGFSQFARVAEIEALTGRPAGQPLLANPAKEMTARWAVLSKALARRPERLEVWTFDPEAPTRFASARFSSGVVFALRSTALHRHPVSDDPVGSTGDYPLPQSKLPDSGPRYHGPRYHAKGLSGGALWPIESKNLFETLIRLPQSTGGTIERIAISPMGGDADQTAKFLDGIVTIISETRNGFVQRQKVEVLGRIGALWHRAKHVVIYERTVNPSAQFAPEPGVNNGSETRTRRPVLRKVREYVELLEPERYYPDFSEASLRHAGPLKAVRFNSKIINVDSAWSEDVGDFGWKIPLWNRYSARIRPQVYPKPDLSFLTAAEGAGDSPTTAQECLNPEITVFFSDFRAGTDLTDRWLTRVAIDYSNLPSAGEVDKDARDEAGMADCGEERNRSVSRIPLGHRQFTWRLAPSAQKTAINANRSATPIYVRMESVTFMRSSPEGPGSADTLKDRLKGVIQEIQNFPGIGSYPSDLIGYWPKDGDAPDKLRDLSDILRDFRKAAEDKDKTKVNNLYKRLLPKFLGMPGDLDTDIQNIKKKIGRLPDVSDLIKSEPTRCEKMAADVAGAIKRKQLLVTEAIRVWEAHVDEILKELLPDTTPPTEKTKAYLNKYLAGQLRTQLSPLIEGIGCDLGNIKAGVETARSIVRDVEADIEGTLRRTLRRIDEFSTNYDREKPWSEHRLKEFRDKLLAITGGVRKDIESATDEARQRFAGELDTLAQEIGTVVARAMTEVSSGNEFLGDLGGKVQKTFEMFLGEAVSKLDELLKPDVNNKDCFDRLIDKTDEALKQGKFESILVALRDAVKAAQRSVREVRQAFQTILLVEGSLSGQLERAVAQATERVRKLIEDIGALTEKVHVTIEKVTDDAFNQFKDELVKTYEVVQELLKPIVGGIQDKLSNLGKIADFLVADCISRVNYVISRIGTVSEQTFKNIDKVANDISTSLSSAHKLMAPENVLTIVQEKVIEPALQTLLMPLEDKVTSKDRNRLEQILKNTSEQIRAGLNELSDSVLGLAGKFSEVCKDVAGGAQAIANYFKDIEESIKSEVDRVAGQLKDYFDKNGVVVDIEKLAGNIGIIDRNIRKISNDLSRSYESALSYGERVLDAAGQVTSGGVMAAPSNLLRLYSAATSAPELAQLQGNIDRLRCNFDALHDVIKTTKAEAIFAHLGDHLKAMGISIPFDQLGDRLLPVDLSNFDFTRIFKNFGGLNLGSLFPSTKLPVAVKDSVKVTHDFDKKSVRAWVQIDVNVPMPGRSTLFEVGPFKLDFVESLLKGKVRLEASKDRDDVQQTGSATISTSMEAVVTGQKMVSLEKVAINYSKEQGLKVDLDPRNIKLNPSFRFIQDTLGTIFGGNDGGLKQIKQNGVPVGVEHEFSMPPIDLMYGTSGVTNIQISNNFRLVAYPDFVIANRFNLSRPELPFIFSIFVIGGTGYVQVDAEYRPFSGDLAVTVEAAAGGAASLGFAFGPVRGSVFMTLSASLSYRKLIGSSGGGLTVALVLVVAGNVNVAGIVNVYIGLLLQMTYRDNGQIDASGTLTLKISISRFFTLKVRTEAKYKLRGGQSETVTKTSTGIETNKDLQDKVDRLKKARG